MKLYYIDKRAYSKDQALEIALKEDENYTAIDEKDHNLIGNWNHHNELHISSDWLLIYRLISKRNTVIFVRTGTHADLF